MRRSHTQYGPQERQILRLAEPSPIYHAVRALQLDTLRLDGGTQARVVINTLVVDEYADALRCGVPFPPIIVFRDGTHLWLADGFHRVAAARQAGLVTLPAEVRPGTRRDAVLYAVGANATHGLRRTHADKRHAVQLLLEDTEWGRWSDREIARRCGVHHDLVGRVRASLAETASDAQRLYRNKYGQVRPMQTQHIGKGAPAFDAFAGLSSELRARLRDTPFADQPAELQALASLAPARQEAVAHLLLEGDARTVRDAMRQLVQTEKRAVTLQETLTGLFPVLYADPPWQYHNARLYGGPEDHYPTMATADLCALPVGDYATTHAVLFLWATNPLLPDALQVLTAWGFTYRTNLVWVKEGRATFGKLGFYAYGRHELLLIGTRGSCMPREGCLPESVLTAAKGAHSAKPADVYAMIERMYDGPYLELFARSQRAGWTCFGNEVRETGGRYTVAPDVTGTARPTRVVQVENNAGLHDLPQEIAGVQEGSGRG